MRRLLLFDIDCTLLNTGGAGMRALSQALPDAFPHLTEDHLPELDLAGSTDSAIVADIFRQCGIEDETENRRAYFNAYAARLHGNMHGAPEAGSLLEGVVELLEGLRERASVGLLTGNIAEGARIKTEFYGVAHHFPFGAFGDDHHDRNELGPIALERARRHTGLAHSAEETFVIGDTPKDIACGKAFGARTFAVATGRFELEALAAFEPDHAVENLADSPAVLDLLLG